MCLLQLPASEIRCYKLVIDLNRTVHYSEVVQGSRMESSFTYTQAAEFILQNEENNKELQMPSDWSHLLNFTSSLNESMPATTYIIVRRMQIVLVPVICMFGVIGNILTTATLLHPATRNMSCCLYLATKNIFDIGFLVSLFVVWLYQVGLSLLLFEGICQITVFLSYMCGFMSVWLVVIITLENFIRISHHSRIPVLCTRRMALIVILSLVCFGLLFCSFSLWTTGVVSSQTMYYCTSLVRFADIIMVMTYIDTTVTLILPSFIVAFLVSAITISAYKSFKRKQRMFGKSQLRSGYRRYKTPEHKVSEFLFALSLIFFILHTPGHIIRIKLIVLQYFENPYPTITDLILQKIFELLFCLSFSVNCLLCYVFGNNFRKVFRKMYIRKQKTQKKCETTVHTDVHFKRIAFEITTPT